MRCIPLQPLLHSVREVGVGGFRWAFCYREGAKALGRAVKTFPLTW